MASALLATHNEPYWGEGKVYMRKTPIPNPNPKFLPNPNPKSKPNSTTPHGHHDHGHNNRLQLTKSPDQPAAVTAASDDSSSFKRKPFDLGRRRETGGYVTYNISSYSAKEMRDLKRRLVSELELVRSVTSRIESGELHSSSSRSAREVASSAFPRSEEAPMTTKKKPLSPPIPPPRSSDTKKLTAGMMSRCGQILTKLMKHKGAEWFNSPVDVARLNLYDYYQIIKEPMDLGTAKSKLAKNLYPSPMAFAEDIRLTFKNALIYNPEGHVVHKVAGQLLRHFESQFAPAHHKYEKQLAAAIATQGATERENAVPSMSHPLLPPPPRLPERQVKKFEPVHPVVVPPPRPRPRPPNPVSVPPPLQSALQQQPVAMPVVGKQAKPKAKDPNKRPMSTEEKEKLGFALANLPQEKATHVLQIIQRKNVRTAQEGDEVELDFELMDNETLWELDRLVCNWKKMTSKMRKQEAMSGPGQFIPPCLTSDTTPPPPPSWDTAIKKSPVAEEEEETPVKKSNKMDAYDEDVDIGDELPVTNYPSVVIEKDPSVEIERDAGYDSSLSSSGGSRSSSGSDSETGSSSGSDSDDDENGAQSPVAGSRPLLKGN